MENYDLAIYGHLTVDKIITGFKQTQTLGAMGNVWSTLSKLNSGINVKLCPTAIGEALIYIDEAAATRTGRANLNLSTSKTKPQNSKWHHAMYLNLLEDKKFINDCSGITSADVTAGKHDIEDYKNLDYLFISDEDLFMDVEELARYIKGTVILHYPSGSYASNGKDLKFHSSIDPINNVNVLGAGDIFAACFMAKKISEYPVSIEAALHYAHSKTKEILENGNK